MTHREQAEELRLALLMGLIDKADVIQWTDGLIETESDLPPWLFDLSLAANDSNDAIANRLRDVADGIEASLPAQKALERLTGAFHAGELRLPDAVKSLETWANSAQVPYEVRVGALSVKFLAEDVADGIYGSPDDVTYAMEQFLARNVATRRTG